MTNSTKTKRKVVREHVCPYEGCSKKYSCHFNVQQHIREAHTNTREYKCELCPGSKGFNRPFSLNRHMRNVHNLDVGIGKGGRQRKARGSTSDAPVPPDILNANTAVAPLGENPYFSYAALAPAGPAVENTFVVTQTNNNDEQIYCMDCNSYILMAEKQHHMYTEHGVGSASNTSPIKNRQTLQLIAQQALNHMQEDQVPDEAMGDVFDFSFDDINPEPTPGLTNDAQSSPAASTQSAPIEISAFDDQFFDYDDTDSEEHNTVLETCPQSVSAVIPDAVSDVFQGLDTRAPENAQEEYAHSSALLDGPYYVCTAEPVFTRALSMATSTDDETDDDSKEVPWRFSDQFDDQFEFDDPDTWFTT